MFGSQNSKIVLFDRDAARLDRPRPFGDLALHEFAEVLWGSVLIRNDFGAERGQLVMHRGRMHGREHGIVNFFTIGSGVFFGRKIAFHV